MRKSTNFIHVCLCSPDLYHPDLHLWANRHPASEDDRNECECELMHHVRYYFRDTVSHLSDMHHSGRKPLRPPHHHIWRTMHCPHPVQYYDDDLSSHSTRNSYENNVLHCLHPHRSQAMPDLSGLYYSKMSLARPMMLGETYLCMRTSGIGARGAKSVLVRERSAACPVVQTEAPY